MVYSCYGSSREISWVSGCAILLLSIATAFTGYSLLWGQMSFWAVTVFIEMRSISMNTVFNAIYAL